MRVLYAGLSVGALYIFQLRHSKKKQQQLRPGTRWISLGPQRWRL